MADGTLFDDDLLFVPAASIGEACARLFSLTGATDPGTRGPKKSLEALAHSVGVDVDLAATNAVLGRQIAAALNAPWRPGQHTDNLQITLPGLNTLLKAATHSLYQTSQLPSVSESPDTDVLRAFPTFAPALDKQEAVNRLSDLAGVARDLLGPGGKEHRVTFDALAQRVAPHLLGTAAARSKHSIVAALCEEFSVPWSQTGGSTGQSVTLQGLNLLLAGAERRLRVVSAGWAEPSAEATALTSVLRQGLPQNWQGRDTVEAMRQGGSRNWRQTEWAGFFFEEQVATLLNVAFPTPPLGGPRRQYGATTFDYASSTRVWDAKAHTVLKRFSPSGREQRVGSAAAILNDASAVEECVREQGLGFLMLDGISTFDETGTFDAWHRGYTRAGRASPTTRANSDRRRARKEAFQPILLRALWIQNLDALNAGIAGGWIGQKVQGPQAVRRGQTRGTKRGDKFHLYVHRASPWILSQATWTPAA